MEHDFKKGDLIVPDDNLSQAFVYQSDDDLYDDTEYRVATSAELIYRFKYMDKTLVTNGIESYKNSKQADVGKIYKHIETGNANERKQGQA